MVTRYNVNFKRDKHNNKLCLLYVCLSGDRAKQMCVRVLVGWGEKRLCLCGFCLSVCVCEREFVSTDILRGCTFGGVYVPCTT